MFKLSKELELADRPLNISTPYLKEPVDLDAEGNFLSAAAVKRLEDLFAQAEGYVEGDRAQGELPLDEDEEEDEDA